MIYVLILGEGKGNLLIAATCDHWARKLECTSFPLQDMGDLQRGWIFCCDCGNISRAELKSESAPFSFDSMGKFRGGTSLGLMLDTALSGNSQSCSWWRRRWFKELELLQDMV